MIAHIKHSLYKKSSELNTNLKYIKKYTSGRIKIIMHYVMLNSKYDAVADPYKIIYIDSNDIKKYYSGDGPWSNASKGIGFVKDGEWDLKDTIPIKQYTIYKSFEDHFCNNIPWEETPIINEKVERRFSHRQEFEKKEELQKHYVEEYKKYDELYHHIKKKGLDLVPMNRPIDYRQYDVIEVHIGRDGEFIFKGNGHHRLAIALLLDLNNIPVRVHVRHENWQKLREKVYKNDISKTQLNDLNSHPDLQDVL